TDTDTNDKDDLDSIDAVQTFKYITSNLEAESLQEKEAIFTLGIYCLKNNETKIAQYSLKRLLMRDKENVDLRCFLVLAISIDGKINEAIESFQSILGRNPNHRYTNVNMGILL
ncbi:MAG TPA: peptidase C14 caspase catalytic subunit p20, partial [Deltaproteobacteria bacterium]|nr:peptidase C14 caspase catalytic subunit p20 [Deltaproteobacteria bacterium]